jgi:hypothetical protein
MPMSGDGLIADLQWIAARFDYYDEDEPDPIGVILNALRAAPRWQKLEQMKAHMAMLDNVEVNIEATVDEVDYLITELHDEIGDRMLVLGPADRLAAEIVLPLVMIVDRNDAGPEVFDQPSLDRLLGVAKIFCVRCMRRDNRSDAQSVRNTAMSMAAGMSPMALGDFNAVQHHRPTGPAVPLVICMDGRKDYRVTPDVWIDAWGARGISI